MVGDGESETGPLATAWHSNKFLNPITDGAVLPVLHLNGWVAGLFAVDADNRKLTCYDCVIPPLDIKSTTLPF
jgi:hypothetical protein